VIRPLSAGSCTARILLAAASVLVLGACRAGPASATSPLETMNAPVLPRQSQESGISVDAVVVPVRHSELSLPLAGNVGTTHVEVGTTVEAGQAILSLRTPELESAVAAAEATLRAARVDAELQRYSNRVLNAAGKFIYQSGPPELRRVTEARVAQAEAELAIAEGRLAQATIAAPYPATVVTIWASPGEWLSVSSPAVTVADLTAFRIETTDLSELDISAIQIGAPVSIYVQALSETFAGHVVSISPLAERNGGETVFRVTVAPEAISAGLRWGMSATITFPSQ